MGTSSARRAPVGKLWRPAKTAASRYASGQGAAPAAVRELVACYCTAQAALNQTDAASSVLIAVGRTAATLGNFYKTWEARGYRAALVQAGVPAGADQTWETLIPALLAVIAGAGATLAEALARAALLDHFEGMWLLGNIEPHPPDLLAEPPPPAEAAVRHFLGLALCRGLLADLGESLEFSAATVNQGLERQSDLRSYVLAALRTWPAATPAPDTWSEARAAGLLQELLTYLKGHHGH